MTGYGTMAMTDQEIKLYKLYLDSRLYNDIIT